MSGVCDGNLCRAPHTAPLRLSTLRNCILHPGRDPLRNNLLYIVCLPSNCILRQRANWIVISSTIKRALARSPLSFSHLLNNSCASYCSPALRIMCFLSVHARCESDATPASDTSDERFCELLRRDEREKTTTKLVLHRVRAPDVLLDRQPAQHLCSTGNIHAFTLIA